MLLNFTLAVKGYPLTKARNDLRHIQLLNPAAFRKWQENKRWETARYHFEHNTVYRSLFTTAFPDNWDVLPVIEKKHLQGNFDNLLSAPFRPAEIYVGNTSGSSGHPFFFAKDKYAHAMTYALIADRYAWHGLKLGQKQARFYGIPLIGRSRQIELAKDLISNRVRFPVFDLSDAQLSVFLKKFSNTKFKYLYGYTSALVLFARYLLDKKIVLKTVCPTLCICIVTSEVCTREDMDILQSAFGLPIANEYGASELDIIAFTDESGDWILSEENLYVEVLDQSNRPVPDGEEGKIIITSLHNRAFPMVRYEIGDLGVIERGAKSRLLQLSGRTNDVIQLPSGKNAAGLTFYYISRSILESGGSLREFIIRQTALDTFVFDVVTDRPLSDSEVSGIRAAMKTYLEDGLILEINRVEKIERPASGKTKHFFACLP